MNFHPYQERPNEQAMKSADVLYRLHSIKDFIFESEKMMYRCRVSSKNALKLRLICIGAVEILKAVKSEQDEQGNDYRIKIYRYCDDDSIEKVLSASELSSYTKFKTLLLSDRVNFVGSRSDFMMLCNHIINNMPK